ncbi:hypothetical protein Tco_1452863 [Tanacetum coccineum]
MSDSDESTVTYTEVSLKAPPSPDYIPGPEEPQSPPPPDFVPEPVYPEYIPQEDEVFPAKEQPLPASASPTDQSPNYVPKSDPEEDPEEDDDEDPEEDLVRHQRMMRMMMLTSRLMMMRRRSTQLLLTLQLLRYQLPIRPHLRRRQSHLRPTSLRPHHHHILHTALLLGYPSEIRYRYHFLLGKKLRDFLLCLLHLHHHFPHVSSPAPVLSPSLPASPIRLLGYRAAMIRPRAEAASTSHSLPLPSPIILSHTRIDAPSLGTPPLHLLSADRRADRPEVTLPPRKRLDIALGPRYWVGESSSAAAARPTRGLSADYGFVTTMDREIMQDLERCRLWDHQHLGRDAGRHAKGTND